MFLIPVGLQREHFENFDCFYIPKEMFRGILREGVVFGIIEWWGEQQRIIQHTSGLKNRHIK